MDQHVCEGNAKKTWEQTLQEHITLFLHTPNSVFPKKNMCDYCYTSMKPPLKEVDLCCFILLTGSSSTCSHSPSVTTHDKRKVKTLWLLRWIDRKSVAGLDNSGEEAFAQLLYTLFQLWNMISIPWSQHRLFLLSFAQTHPWDRFLRAEAVTGDNDGNRSKYKQRPIVSWHKQRGSCNG